MYGSRARKQMKFANEYSELRESEKRFIRFNDLIPFVFSMTQKIGTVHCTPTRMASL